VEYRAAVGSAVAALFLLVWLNLAAGVIAEPDHPANVLYFGVMAVGIIGAVIARVRPRGMALALLTTALAQGMAAVIALISRVGSPGSGLLEILALNGVFVTLFVGSAWLFRRAAERHPSAGAGPTG
jgi:hypothetical protein